MEPERDSEGFSCGAGCEGGAALFAPELEKGHQLMVEDICACGVLVRESMFERLQCMD